MAAIAEREAAGESLWTDQIPRRARVKIAAAWEEDVLALGYTVVSSHMEVMAKLQTMTLGEDRPHTEPKYWQNIEDTDLSLSILEAAVVSLRILGGKSRALEDRINDVFNSHRVAFRMVDEQFVPLSSDELHVQVVEPALRLLIDKRFTAAHSAYMDALKEISADKPGDAITDAGTALQEVLGTLDCKGNSLGPLIKDAKSRGLLGSHDQVLTDGIVRFMDWASADRSTTGDSHKTSQASVADAWLMVHVVGALIVRLADPKPRGTVDAISTAVS